MPRRENPIDPHAPYAGLALLLRRAREEAGLPPYEALAHRTGFSVSALAQAASGRRLPSLAVTVAYGTACGGDREFWAAQWNVARTRRADAGFSASGPALPPDPGGCRTVGEFVQCLRELKAWAGEPSLGWVSRHMSRHLDTHAGRSTVGDALNLRRRSLPRLPLLVGFVRSCLHFAASYGGRGGGPGVLEWYRGAWHRLRRALSEVAREEGGGRSATAPGKEVELFRWRQSRPLVPLDSGLPAEVVTLADTLRDVVRSRHCSIRQVAGAVFVSPATMSRYLNGHRVPPRDVVDRLAAFAAPGPGDGTALRTMLHELRWKALNATGPRTALTVELAERLDDTHSRTGALDAEVTRLKSEVTDLTMLLQQAYEDAQRLSAARRSTWGKAPVSVPVPVPVYGDVFAGLRAQVAPQPRRLAVPVRQPSGSARVARVVRTGAPSSSSAAARGSQPVPAVAGSRSAAAP
ncbi:helix-turn-helix transcriptional regulator [Kitasatospora sp. NPDC091257]|uniref:helix-turn-helix transcriptional regulator n=1 Tax=unclassified Kitasatospora TaxID=2633591 RepID=UPI002F9086D3